MMHDFYDPVNLQRLHTALPLLHSQLEKILMQIHECWQFLVSDPAPPNEDRILSVLDLVDFQNFVSVFEWNTIREPDGSFSSGLIISIDGERCC